MRLSSWQVAWSALGALALLMLWGLANRESTTAFLCVPLVLWVLLLRLQRPIIWWALLMLYLYGLFYYLDLWIRLQGPMMFHVCIFLLTPLLMLMDPPGRWSRDELLMRPPMIADSRSQRRQDFLNWWARQNAETRERVWMRLLPEEREWALAEMPPDIRTVYLQYERSMIGQAR